MKKILSIFTTVSLLTPTVNTIISCNKAHKYISDDDSNNIGNDIEILNNINVRVKKHLDEWWNTKTKIDITEYPDQVEKFKELVTNLKTNDGQVLTGAAIREWRFLDQLYTGFETEFNNLNHEIKNEYSNYYTNVMPLSLDSNDISFTLNNINFHNLAKLITINNDNIMGITFNFRIRYEVKFKDLQQRDEINGYVVICNDFDALSEIQKNLANYFISFVDDIFKEQKYEIIDTSNRDFNKVDKWNTIWPIISKALKEKGISFKNPPSWNRFYTSFGGINRTIYKKNSVLAWAGEGYDPKKLTAEKFLEFYKKYYFNVSVQENYYVKANIESLFVDKFRIENLPLKENYDKRSRELKNRIKVLLPKDFIDERLNQFAQTTMKFWQYYQLETYNDKLVFKMTQTDYDRILKATNSFSPDKSSFANLEPVFVTIFEIFNKTVDSKIIRDTRIDFGSRDKVNLIKENNSFTFEYFRKKVDHVSYKWNDINFSYNSFVYSFFFKPNDDEGNTNNPGEFLQKIEFKVV